METTHGEPRDRRKAMTEIETRPEGGNKITMGAECYWRFIGEKAWHYGWPSRIEPEYLWLFRMGAYSDDTITGTIVSLRDVEIKQ